MCLGLFLAGGLHAQETKAPEKKPMMKKEAKLWAAGDIKWTDVAEVKGAQSAVLWGDPKKGAYGELNKWPAGTEVPLHTHTYDTKGVIHSGTMVLTIEGQAPKELGPGSYIFVPGGLKHSTTCKAGAECVFFAEQPGMSDIKMVEAAKK